MDDSTIVFNKNNDIYLINKELKKSSLSFKNRLQSIIYDSNFVNLVHQNLNLPIIANERCGLWYTSEKSGSCYFKSTDGHTNVWSFSTRRLNLHLLPIIQQNGGIIIIDSTRRGKPMPDSLLKTIPIWCSVLNSILYEEEDDFWLNLPEIVPKHEYNSILKLIPSFIQTVRSMNLFSKETQKLRKPLKTIWLYPGCDPQILNDDAYNICLVSVSKQVPIHKTIQIKAKNDSILHFDYVQGSADDHELWVPRSLLPTFGPTQFWEIFDKIVDKSTGYLPSWINDDELEEMIGKLLLQTSDNGANEIEVNAVGDTGLYIGSINRNYEAKKVSNFKQVIVLSDKFRINEYPEKQEGNIDALIANYSIPNNKKGSNILRSILPDIMSKFDPIQVPLLILCGSGSDISVGVLA
ncbi:RIT1 [Candida pseudojiufengensis]|uniref:RIT1 n=1 Tax=Candida pseudojiufengensis TaxID=497109 RepID=UPI0022250F01|nr:RIT1 [Candida pseudojiufengensis]KAI5960942.1 RIT1 [Candida pseudojiufengensis]